VWAYSVVACYPAEHSMVVKGLQEVNRLVGTPGGGVPFYAEAVMDAAWSNDREGMYQPVKIQDHFWLVPVWCEVQRQPCDTLLNTTRACQHTYGLSCLWRHLW